MSYEFRHCVSISAYVKNRELHSIILLMKEHTMTYRLAKKAELEPAQSSGCKCQCAEDTEGYADWYCERTVSSPQTRRVCLRSGSSRVKDGRRMKGTLQIHKKYKIFI